MLVVSDDGAPRPPSLFKALLRVRWGDLDADGHVNHATVLRYVEEARMMWLSQLNIVETHPELMPVIAKIGIQYQKPIPYPAELMVNIACVHLGNSSIGLTFEMHGAEPVRVLHAHGCVTWVWVDAKTKRPSAIPAPLREICQLDRPNRLP